MALSFCSVGVSIGIELKFEKCLSKSVLYILSSQVQRENILRLSKGLGFVLFVVIFDDFLRGVPVESNQISTTLASYVVAVFEREGDVLHSAPRGGSVKRCE